MVGGKKRIFRLVGDVFSHHYNVKLGATSFMNKKHQVRDQPYLSRRWVAATFRQNQKSPAINENISFR